MRKLSRVIMVVLFVLTISSSTFAQSARSYSPYDGDPTSSSQSQLCNDKLDGEDTRQDCPRQTTSACPSDSQKEQYEAWQQARDEMLNAASQRSESERRHFTAAAHRFRALTKRVQKLKKNFDDYTKANDAVNSQQDARLDVDSQRWLDDHNKLKKLAADCDSSNNALAKLFGDQRNRNALFFFWLIILSLVTAWGFFTRARR